jgi:hypothetical protein
MPDLPPDVPESAHSLRMSGRRSWLETLGNGAFAAALLCSSAGSAALANYGASVDNPHPAPISITETIQRGQGNAATSAQAFGKALSETITTERDTAKKQAEVAALDRISRQEQSFGTQIAAYFDRATQPLRERDQGIQTSVASISNKLRDEPNQGLRNQETSQLRQLQAQDVSLREQIKHTALHIVLPLGNAVNDKVHGPLMQRIAADAQTVFWDTFTGIYSLFAAGLFLPGVNRLVRAVRSREE